MNIDHFTSKMPYCRIHQISGKIAPKLWILLITDNEKFHNEQMMRSVSENPKFPYFFILKYSKLLLA